MSIATIIVSALFATLVAYSAIRKLGHEEAVVEGYRRAGVPEDKLNSLAMLLLAGAAGLLIGLVWAPVGVAASAALTLYFLVAVGFHLRADDTKHLPTPLLMLVLAGAALLLQLESL